MINSVEHLPPNPPPHPPHHTPPPPPPWGGGWGGGVPPEPELPYAPAFSTNFSLAVTVDHLNKACPTVAESMALGCSNWNAGSTTLVTHMHAACSTAVHAPSQAGWLGPSRGFNLDTGSTAAAPARQDQDDGDSKATSLSWRCHSPPRIHL